ncbi:flagellar biosynthetic protein FliO [bacterium]|nr:flagellar biosynthetic protein FliO [bacterium]
MIYFLAQIDSAAATTEMSFGWLLVKTLLALAFILALAFVFIRFLLPKLNFAQNIKQNVPVKILSRTGLEARKALYVIEVGKKKALIAATDHNVTKIFDLNDDDLK